MKKLLSLLYLYLIVFSAWTQEIRLLENHSIIESKDFIVYNFGFHEGDRVRINFIVNKGKYVSSVEMKYYQSTTLYSEFKPRKISDKVISIPKTGIYQIVIHNQRNKKCVFKIEIDRLPISGHEHFNTEVTTKTIPDTNFYTVWEDYLISKDTIAYELINQIAKVNSNTNLNGHKNTIAFTLPENTISWSYFIGVGQESQEAMEHATNEFYHLSKPVLAIPGYGLMAAIALNAAPIITKIQHGEDIDFYFADKENTILFLKGESFHSFKRGKVIMDYGYMNSPIKGKYYVCLSNNNLLVGVTVEVRITAITVTENWSKRLVQKFSVIEKTVLLLED